jgi:hypothetical protein
VKSSAKVFSTLLILVLVVAGLFFSSVKVLKFFSEKENSSLKKMILLKPKDMKDKQALVELGASLPDDFTFFDVLDDPEMKKYIGLDGSVVAIKEEGFYKLNDLTPKVDGSLAPQVIQSVSKNVITRVTKNREGQKLVDPSTSGFVLQVGSFQEIQKADALKNKLINSNYPVFIVSTLVKEKGYTLHRVFVGRFLRKIEAEKVAVRIKESEKIEPLVRSYEKKS